MILGLNISEIILHGRERHLYLLKGTLCMCVEGGRGKKEQSMLFSDEPNPDMFYSPFPGTLLRFNVRLGGSLEVSGAVFGISHNHTLEGLTFITSANCKHDSLEKGRKEAFLSRTGSSF